jgi:hypothetical protein
MPELNLDQELLLNRESTPRLPEVKSNKTEAQNGQHELNVLKVNIPAIQKDVEAVMAINGEQIIVKALDTPKISGIIQKLIMAKESKHKENIAMVSSDRNMEEIINDKAEIAERALTETGLLTSTMRGVVDIFQKNENKILQADKSSISASIVSHEGMHFIAQKEDADSMVEEFVNLKFEKSAIISGGQEIGLVIKRDELVFTFLYAKAEHATEKERTEKNQGVEQQSKVENKNMLKRPIFDGLIDSCKKLINTFVDRSSNRLTPMLEDAEIGVLKNSVHRIEDILISKDIRVEDMVDAQNRIGMVIGNIGKAPKGRAMREDPQNLERLAHYLQSTSEQSKAIVLLLGKENSGQYDQEISALRHTMANCQDSRQYILKLRSMFKR